MFLDKLAPGFHFVSHENAEQVIGGGGVFHGHLHQRPVLRAKANQS